MERIRRNEGSFLLSHRTPLASPVGPSPLAAKLVVHRQPDLRRASGKRELRVLEAWRPHEPLGVVRGNGSLRRNAEESRVQLPVLVLVVKACDGVGSSRD